MPDSLQPTWTGAHQAPLSMEFSRQEWYSGLLSPPPGDLSNPGIEPRTPALQADSLPSEPPGKPMLVLGEIMVMLLCRRMSFLEMHANVLKNERP